MDANDYKKFHHADSFIRSRFIFVQFIMVLHFLSKGIKHAYHESAKYIKILL